MRKLITLPSEVPASALANLQRAKPSAEAMFAQVPPEWVAAEREQTLDQAMLGLTDVIMKLSSLQPKSRRLFLGGKSLEEFALTIREHIAQRGTHLIDIRLETEGSTDLAEGRCEHLWRDTVQILGRIYGSALSTEYSVLSKKLQTFDDAQKQEYLAQLPSFPEGPLVRRVLDAVVSATDLAVTRPAQPSNQHAEDGLADNEQAQS